jgi:hypothetical protein
VYLLPAIVASLVSANLNSSYLACGATAGVCALLGCVAADQALHFRKKRLFNLKEWWLVALLLALNAAAFICLSLLPMTDVWFPSAGLLAGFLLSVILLAVKRVGRGKPNNTRWAAAQITCAVLLVGGTTAAIVGCAMPTKLGESLPVLRDAGCVDFGGKMWACTPYGSVPGGCSLSLGTAPGNATLTCAAGGPALPVPGATAAVMSNTTALQALCTSYCAVAPPSPPLTIIAPTNDTLSTLAPADVAAAPAPGGAAAVPVGATPSATFTPAASTAPAAVIQPLQPVATAPPTPVAAPVVTTPAVSAPTQPMLIYAPVAPGGAAATVQGLIGRKLRAGSSLLGRAVARVAPNHESLAGLGRKMLAGRAAR